VFAQGAADWEEDSDAHACPRDHLVKFDISVRVQVPDDVREDDE
jgi:hypothetical protein